MGRDEAALGPNYSLVFGFDTLTLGKIFRPLVCIHAVIGAKLILDQQDCDGRLDTTLHQVFERNALSKRYGIRIRAAI